ncbi:Coenzyme Q-binding protein coq10, mitochondrial [Paraconiothyrium brasiliense]|uniref:Coenzyme Q-binding protein coq10, mitochondrial n=1 Tax=Paraconiothyrium brasiliense TaxID=300254 RepID=A0ABR3QUY8_9PLEO
MAAPRTLRSFLHRPNHRLANLPQRRTFFPNPFQSSLNPLNGSAQPQTLTAQRVLPYPAAPIYSIVSDVQSYSSFLPYCQSSAVTRWSSPDSTYARKWPSEASLVIGWGNLTESFSSRVFCVPGRLVESIGGDTETDLKAQDITHHLEGVQDGDKGARGAANGLMTHLRSRWTIEALEKDTTKVTLALEFAFSNPMYMALSAGAAPKVADIMVKAFEERVKKLLDGNPEMARAELGELEGSRLRK